MRWLVQLSLPLATSDLIPVPPVSSSRVAMNGRSVLLQADVAGYACSPRPAAVPSPGTTFFCVLAARLLRRAVQRLTRRRPASKETTPRRSARRQVETSSATGWAGPATKTRVSVWLAQGFAQPLRADPTTAYSTSVLLVVAAALHEMAARRVEQGVGTGAGALKAMGDCPAQNTTQPAAASGWRCAIFLAVPTVS